MEQRSKQQEHEDLFAASVLSAAAQSELDMAMNLHHHAGGEQEQGLPSGKPADAPRGSRDPAPTQRQSAPPPLEVASAARCFKM